MSITTLSSLGLKFCLPSHVSNMSAKRLRSMVWSFRVARKRGLRIPAYDLCALSEPTIRRTQNPVAEVQQIGQFYFVQFFVCAGCCMATDQLIQTDAKEFLSQIRRCPLLDRYWFLCIKEE